MCYAFAYSDGCGVSLNLFATQRERDQAVYDLLADDYEESEETIQFGTPDQDDAETMWVKHCSVMRPDYNLTFGNL